MDGLRLAGRWAQRLCTLRKEREGAVAGGRRAGATVASVRWRAICFGCFLERLPSIWARPRLPCHLPSHSASTIGMTKRSAFGDSVSPRVVTTSFAASCTGFILSESAWGGRAGDGRGGSGRRAGRWRRVWRRALSRAGRGRPRRGEAHLDDVRKHRRNPGLSRGAELGEQGVERDERSGALVRLGLALVGELRLEARDEPRRLEGQLRAAARRVTSRTGPRGGAEQARERGGARGRAGSAPARRPPPCLPGSWQQPSFHRESRPRGPAQYRT